MFDALAQLLHFRFIDAVAGPRPVDLAAYQAGLPQHFQVLRDRGLGQRHDIDDLAADADAAPGEGSQDGQPGGMRQGLAGQGQGFEVFQVGSRLHGFIVYRRYTIVKPHLPTALRPSAAALIQDIPIPPPLGYFQANENPPN